MVERFGAAWVDYVVLSSVRHDDTDSGNDDAGVDDVDDNASSLSSSPKFFIHAPIAPLSKRTGVSHSCEGYARMGTRKAD